MTPRGVVFDTSSGNRERRSSVISLSVATCGFVTSGLFFCRHVAGTTSDKISIGRDTVAHLFSDRHSIFALEKIDEPGSPMDVFFFWILVFPFSASAITAPEGGEVVTSITDAAMLTRLEHTSLRFSQALSLEAREEHAPAINNEALYRASSWYRDVVADLDLALDGIGDEGEYTYGAEFYTDRLFNKGWLRSPYAEYELIGVVNRIDRRDFQTAPGCGEVRFLYRLSYHKTDVSDALYSRMPFVFNVIYDIPRPENSDCSSAAMRWKTAHAITDRDAFFEWASAMLDITDRAHFRFNRVEVNFQSMRKPSESKKKLGGHAEYILRMYAPDATGGLGVMRLENSPDVAKIKKDAALKAELQAYILSHVEEIDQGVYQLPEKFLTTDAVSVGPHGLHRSANHPFEQIFKSADFDAADFTQTRLIASSEGLLARLDGNTCVGCHQSNAVAGFHFLGEDRPDRTHPLNALHLSSSPHFRAEAARRAVYLRALIEAGEPDRFRPLAIEPAGGSAPVNGRCFVDDADFKDTWSCVEGAQCEALIHNARVLDVGTCVRPDTSVAGDPCFKGVVTEEPWRGASKDKMQLERFGCPDRECSMPKQGSPLGMCQASCDEDGDAEQAGEICAWRGGLEFEKCAMSGDWSGCIDESARRGLRGACDEQTPCRDDYICQRAVDAGDAAPLSGNERGYCVPNYFIFQLRLDGHPPTPLLPEPFAGFYSGNPGDNHAHASRDLP